MNQRTFKFRAWNRVTQQMVELKKITPFAIDPSLNGLFIPEDGNLDIMQFTGLHDKNGKEIYEGDVVKSIASEIGEVVFGKYVTDNNENEDILGWCISMELGVCALDPQCDYEVIGNIYSNPELLGERGKE